VARVLVTGGTGVLGREVVPRLVKAGYIVRVMSRRDGQSNALGDVEWAKGDMRSGEGLADAVRDVDTIVHCASSPFKKTMETDVEGTRKLLSAAKAAGVSHFYYISIVGIDRINYPYYKAKLATEKVIEGGGVPWTILRATQFHPLLADTILPMMKKGPFLLLPGSIKFQLIDPGEVADHMVATLANGPGGHIPDIGGPEVQTARQIARDWKQASGQSYVTIPIPAAGPLSAMAKAYNCCPNNVGGKITFREWLSRRYPKSS
jgi:uncharacterized protein YbjT (DUF2867 family)